MENKNMVVGAKDPEYYVDLFSFLKRDLKIMKRTWYLLDFKHPIHNEVYKYKFLYFRREYINQVTEFLSKLDFEAISKIPHEKGNCAFMLECRYIKSGKVFSAQLVEARVGSSGGYFSVSPALVLFDEEAQRAYKAMRKKL